MLLISKQRFYKGNQLFVIYMLFHQKKQKQIQYGNLKNAYKDLRMLPMFGINTMKTFILSINPKVSQSDPSLFYFINESSIIGCKAIQSYGDIIWSETDLFNINILISSGQSLKLEKNTIQFHLLGLDISSMLSETHYIMQLSKSKFISKSKWGINFIWREDSISCCQIIMDIHSNTTKLFMLMLLIQCLLINWQLKHIKRDVPSPLSAETLALCDVIDYAIFLPHMMSNLLVNNSVKIPINLYTDNWSLFDTLPSTSK